MDTFRHKFCEGAEFFEHNGMAYARYNAKLKIAGDSVKICFYEKGILAGFPKNKRQVEGKETLQEEYDPQKRWDRTGLNAKRKVYDYVAANLGKARDHNGKKQRFKFLTFTFREDIQDFKVANREYKDFIARLNYFFTGKKGSNFLKYVAVPELQTEREKKYGIPVWHFHTVFFNLPYIPVSAEIVDELIGDGRLKPDYDKRDTLFYIWGNGGVDVEQVKFSDPYNVAGYITKYISKSLDSKYKDAEKKGTLGRNRYLISKGLLPPRVLNAFLNKEQRQSITDYFRQHHKKFKRKSGSIGSYFETFTVDNEEVRKYCGRIFGINFRSNKRNIRLLEEKFERYCYGLC